MTIYKLNRNPDGQDVIHREHPFEECNVDDAEGLEKIDALQAMDALDSGQAVACQHCRPEL